MSAPASRSRCRRSLGSARVESTTRSCGGARSISVCTALRTLRLSSSWKSSSTSATGLSLRVTRSTIRRTGSPAGLTRARPVRARSTPAQNRGAQLSSRSRLSQPTSRALRRARRPGREQRRLAGARRGGDERERALDAAVEERVQARPRHEPCGQLRRNELRPEDRAGIALGARRAGGAPAPRLRPPPQRTRRLLRCRSRWSTEVSRPRGAGANRVRPVNTGGGPGARTTVTSRAQAPSRAPVPVAAAARRGTPGRSPAGAPRSPRPAARRRSGGTASGASASVGPHQTSSSSKTAPAPNASSGRARWGASQRRALVA